MRLPQDSFCDLFPICAADTRMVNAADPRIALKMFSQRLRIFAMAIHAQCESLYAAKNLVRFPWTQHSAYQFHHSNQCCAVGSVARNRDAAHCISMAA